MPGVWLERDWEDLCWVSGPLGAVVVVGERWMDWGRSTIVGSVVGVDGKCALLIGVVAPLTIYSTINLFPFKD